MASRVDLWVIDGSDADVESSHSRWWGQQVNRHRPDPRYHFRNGKVDGVLTGLRLVRNERVIIADDDVRYDEDGLRQMADALSRADLVRPQNYFDPLPWHARWDTARTLLNRAFGADYPGTLGVRKSLVLAVGGYDGDAMFENLELIRTVEAAGGTVDNPLGLYVRRIPPTSRQFFSQRLRQAFDDFAQPGRLLASLSCLPAGAVLTRRFGARSLAGVATAVIAVAEVGRRRAGGARVFPKTAPLLAPAWLLERAVCSWLALASRMLLGGVPYRGGIVPLAANPTHRIRERLLLRADLDRGCQATDLQDLQRGGPGPVNDQHATAFAEAFDGIHQYP
ncbi:MAG TPA: hypothetical protein VF711_07560 [Acidimicrobiales bacterium]